MATIYVQFTDANHTAIQNAYDMEPPDDAGPNQGTLDSSDPLWKAFYDAMPFYAKPYWPEPD